jgi:hypothetical protein
MKRECAVVSLAYIAAAEMVNISNWWRNTVDVLGGAAHAVIDSVISPEEDDVKPLSHSTISSTVNVTKNWIFNAGHDIGNWFGAMKPKLPSLNPMSIPMSIISSAYTSVTDKFSPYIFYIKWIAIFLVLVFVAMCAEKLLLLCKPLSFALTMLNNCVRNVSFAVLRACRFAPIDADYVTAISFCIAGSSAHVRLPPPPKLPPPTLPTTVLINS